MSSAFPVVIVTGANGGLGFGICQRLLFQLASSQPSDAQPQAVISSASKSFYGLNDATVPVEGLTLIMACRSTKRAETARTSLLASLDSYVAKQKKLPEYDGHAENFQVNLKIEVYYLDLAIVQSVFKFGSELSKRYTYVSHVICNAGVASFSGLDWPKAISELCRNPLVAVTSPVYYNQHVGEKSGDGLGWVWQCNVFGHYCLFRTLERLLAASKSSLGARVIWMSSMEASPEFYETADWQLIKTDHSYEASKYQIDLISTLLDRKAIAKATEKTVTIRHTVAQPGCVHTNITKSLIGPLAELAKLLIFYLVRLLGSQNHNIHILKGAISAVHLSLISIPLVMAISLPGSQNAQPVRFGSNTTRWGEEYVGITPVKGWESHEKEAFELLGKYDKLYGEFWESEGTPQY